MLRAKWRLACWVCGLPLFAVSTTSVSAIEYRYEFAANPGQLTEFNGTSIELEVTPAPDDPSSLSASMRDFNLQVMNGSFPPASAPASFSLWPAESYFVDMISYAGPSDWGGFCYGYANFPFGGGGSLSWVISDQQVGFYVDGSPDIPSQYASGTWVRVPDTGSAFGLLAGAMIAIGAGHRFLAARKR